MRYQAVLFDLDGTLADTAPDLGYALNLLRAEHGLPPLADDVIRPVASHGARGLIALGFGVTPQDADFNALRTRFLAHYEANLSRQSRLFDGVPELLAGLEAQNIKWGIVTNKPTRYTLPLVAALGLSERSGCIVCGDTCDHPKPHPAPLLLAAQIIDTPPHACLYVGDAQRDIDAGRNAGMVPVIALYGYLDALDTPHLWEASGVIESPDGIWALLSP